MFQASLFKMSFTKIILIYFFVIPILSTQTLIWSQINLGFHCFYLENTCNFVSQEKWEPCICFNTFFEIFITKFFNKVPGIWRGKKLEKNVNLGPNTLRKLGIWYLENSGNPEYAYCIKFIIFTTCTISVLLFWHYHFMPMKHLYFSTKLVKHCFQHNILQSVLCGWSMGGC